MSKLWTEVQGYFTEFDNRDYEHLVNGLPDNSLIVEVGCFRGRSLASVSETIIRKNINVWAVDIFDKIDSLEYVEEDVYKKKDGMLKDFEKTVSDFGLNGLVQVNVMTSLEAASLFATKGLKADMVFLDGNHEYEYVRKEIESWWPLVKVGGVLSWHDYDHNGRSWPGVHKAIHEIFGQPYFGVYVASVRKVENGWETESFKN